MAQGCVLKGGAQAPSPVTFPSQEVAGVGAGDSQGHRPALSSTRAPGCPSTGASKAEPRQAWSGECGVGQALDGHPAGMKPILHFQFAKQAPGFRLEEPRGS